MIAEPEFWKTLLKIKINSNFQKISRDNRSKQIKEKNVNETYTDDEISNFEESIGTIVPEELRFYLKNVSKYIVRGNIYIYLLLMTPSIV